MNVDLILDLPVVFLITAALWHLPAQILRSRIWPIPQGKNFQEKQPEIFWSIAEGEVGFKRYFAEKIHQSRKT